MPDFDGNDIPPSPPLPDYIPARSPRWPFNVVQPQGSTGRQILHGLIGDPRKTGGGGGGVGFSGLLAGILGTLMGFMGLLIALAIARGLWRAETPHWINLIPILLTGGVGFLFIWFFGRLAIESFIIIARAFRQILSPRR